MEPGTLTAINVLALLANLIIIVGVITKLESRLTKMETVLGLIAQHLGFEVDFS